MEGKFESLSLYHGDKKIAEIKDGQVISSNFNTDGWEEYLEEMGEPWEIEINLDIIEIDFNETWLIAYHARMYAETFRS